MAQANRHVLAARPPEPPSPPRPTRRVLDRVPNPHPDTDYVARFTCAGIHLAVPGHRPAGLRASRHRLRAATIGWSNSKSLKLYLDSFRNHGAFHEDCTVAIGKRLAALLKPHWLRIGGYWYPRGGMPIDVFWQSGRRPAGVWLPDQGVAPYRGRG